MRRALSLGVCVGSLFMFATTATASRGGWTLPASASAVWTQNQGDDHGLNYGLVTTSSGAGTYTSGTYGEADLNLAALPTTDPTRIRALSYDFNPAQAGPSGGSPRMVVCFGDSVPLDSCNSNGELGPNSWTANTWTHVDGFAPSDGLNNVWVNSGGTCGYLYNTTWSTIVGCHPNQSITQVRVVNDSGWLFPASSSEQVTLDNLDVNGAIATGP